MGLMSKYVIEVYALSGVVVRANDFRKDLRLVGYSYYSRIEFNVVVGIKGDSMDRYLVRMNESLESVKTLNKCIRTLTTWYLSYTEVYGHVLTNMESMIHYFKLVTEGYTFTLGQTYLRQESPKGELGCYIVHGQTTHPCRVSIRTPDYTNLQAVHVLSTDHYVADHQPMFSLIMVLLQGLCYVVDITMVLALLSITFLGTGGFLVIRYKLFKMAVC